MSHSIGLTCWEQGCGKAFLGDSLRSPRLCDLLACQLASRREDHGQVSIIMFIFIDTPTIRAQDAIAVAFGQCGQCPNVSKSRGKVDGDRPIRRPPVIVPSDRSGADPKGLAYTREKGKLQPGKFTGASGSREGRTPLCIKPLPHLFRTGHNAGSSARLRAQLRCRFPLHRRGLRFLPRQQLGAATDRSGYALALSRNTFASSAKHPL